MRREALSDTSTNGDTAGGTLTIESSGGIVADLKFAGDYSSSSFTLEPDSGAGTLHRGVSRQPIIESTNHGDWGQGTIWNTGTAPNAAADYVLVQTQVTDRRRRIVHRRHAGDFRETNLFAKPAQDIP